MNYYSNNAQYHAVTWVHQILPYIEQGAIYDLLVTTVLNQPSGINPVEGIVKLGGNNGIKLTVMFCPSDELDGNKEQATYACNGGVPDITNLPTSNYPYGVDWDVNGVFDNRMKGKADTSLKIFRTTLGSIVDGATNTVMFAENMDVVRWNMNGWGTVGTDGEANACILWQDGTVNQFSQQLNQIPPTGNLNQTTARPSSNHPAGFMMVFCDGHTKFINEGLNYNVYQRLMTSNGKKYLPAGTNTVNTNVTATRNAQSVPLSGSDF
jgi:prepilin-type processing-associated H-X9-DG protein